MKYFNLSQEELTLMKILTRKRFFPYIFSLVVTLTFIFIFYSKFIKDPNDDFIAHSSSLILITGLILALFLIHFIYSCGIVQSILKKNQKVIYSGMLAEKKIKENGNNTKYVFYMDGMKFSVDKMDFQSFNSGDLIEFHVSLNGKHLIKISRPSSLSTN